MVEDAMRPVAAEFAVVAAAQKRGVFARNRRLVAITVERPGLHLAFVQLPAMQELMKGMFIVIALGADGAKLLFQFLGAHDLGHGATSLPGPASVGLPKSLII